MIDFAQARRNMIDSQLRPCDVKDPLLLQAIEMVPRERFIASGREAHAYIDQHVALTAENNGRHMMQPMILARMIQALNLLPGEKVLDVACGYGYASALMAEIGAQVVALEDDEAVAAVARERNAGNGKISFVTGNLSEGAPQHAPFDAILINGAIEAVPSKLLSQLKDGGRLIAIRMENKTSRAILHTRTGDAFGNREIIDATAPVLKGFIKDASFVF